MTNNNTLLYTKEGRIRMICIIRHYLRCSLLLLLLLSLLFLSSNGWSITSGNSFSSPRRFQFCGYSGLNILSVRDSNNYRKQNIIGANSRSCRSSRSIRSKTKAFSLSSSSKLSLINVLPFHLGSSTSLDATATAATSTGNNHGIESESDKKKKNMHGDEKNNNRFFGRYYRKLLPTSLSVLAGYAIGSIVQQIKYSSSSSSTNIFGIKQGVGVARKSINSWAKERPLVTLLLFAIGVKEIWFATPEWLKKNVPLFGKRYRRTALTLTDDDDMTSLTALGTKLGSLFEVANAKFHKYSDNDPKQRKRIRIALLVLLQIKLFEIGKKKENKTALTSTSTTMNNQHKHHQHNGSSRMRKTTAKDDQDYDDQQKRKHDAKRATKIIPMVPNKEKVFDHGLDELFEFADWAYDDLPDGQSLDEVLAGQGYTLLRHEKPALPGYVSHYVAVNTQKKVALISIKGTSSFEDILTDCCGRAVTYYDSDNHNNCSTTTNKTTINTNNITMRCHEGILLSSQRLASRLETLVESVLLPAGYNKILLTGHSLGAGVAALVGVILKNRFFQKQEQQPSSSSQVLRVVAFASPPVLDYDTAINCSSYITTVVNNADIVPRSSLSNLIVLMEYLKIIDEKLDHLEIGVPKPTEYWDVPRFMLANRRAEEEAQQSIANNTINNNGNGNNKTILSPGDIENGLYQACSRVKLRDPDHLYVPGRVIHIYYNDTATEQKQHKNDRSSEKDDQQGCVAIKKEVGKKAYIPLFAKKEQQREVKSRIINGPSSTLRSFQLETTLLSDHMPPSYRKNIRSLLLPSPESYET